MPSRKEYMREYMRKRRAKAGAETGEAVTRKPITGMTEDRLREIVREEVERAMGPIVEALTRLTVNTLAAPDSPPEDADRAPDEEQDDSAEPAEPGAEFTELTVNATGEAKPPQEEESKEERKARLIKEAKEADRRDREQYQSKIAARLARKARWRQKTQSGKTDKPEAGQQVESDLGLPDLKPGARYGAIQEALSIVLRRAAASSIPEAMAQQVTNTMDTLMKLRKYESEIKEKLTFRSVNLGELTPPDFQQAEADICAVYNRARMGGLTKKDVRDGNAVCTKYLKQCRDFLKALEVNAVNS